MPAFRVDLTQRSAIVTGAGADSGRAIALAFADSGARVLVNDLNPDRVERVVAEIRDAGGEAIGWQGDVTNRFQVSAMIEQARDQFGGVNILVNAAGAESTSAPLLTLDEWDWRRMIEVNMTGAFFCSQLLGRVMADEGGGVIVNIASTAGHPDPLPQGAAYVASKSGLIGFTKQCAQELAPQGVRVNAVCPANIETDTPQNAQGRAGDWEDVAQAVLFLCSDAASFITGQCIHVDGGGSML